MPPLSVGAYSKRKELAPGFPKFLKGLLNGKANGKFQNSSPYAKMVHKIFEVYPVPEILSRLVHNLDYLDMFLHTARSMPML